ncbi:hypothetical protein [Streptomyces sp. NPDC006739]|uniref:hypothetical protein n=1 Tax=Streptomyces sp. NPDC006739 TaxID=3364763 RepID=UPI0036CD6488
MSDDSVRQVVAAVVRRAGTGRTVVSLDGRAGAGKSTLAAAVAASLRPQGGYGRLFAWRQLRDQALVPLSEGRPAHYAPYDPATNSLRHGAPRTVPPVRVVIVEGALTARPELAAFYVWRRW